MGLREKMKKIILFFSLVSTTQTRSPIDFNLPVGLYQHSAHGYHEVELEQQKEKIISRQRRDYSDIENSVSSFLDDVDFYLEKVGIIRYIILDVRQLYSVLKSDVIYLMSLVENLRADDIVEADEVLEIIDYCTRFIDHLILYLDVILQGWSDLLWPWIDFDKSIVMDYLDYLLRITQFIQNSSSIIE